MSLISKTVLGKPLIKVFVLFIFGAALAFWGFNLSEKTSSLNNVSQKIKRIRAECQDQSGNSYFLCFRKKAIPLLNKYGLKNVIVSLDKLGSEVPTGTSCHEEAHIIGEIAGQAGDLGQVIKDCSRRCGYGCVHGAVLGKIQKDESLLENLTLICEDLEVSKYPTQDVSACHHGIGHALSEYTGYDVLGSLSFCQKLGNDLAREECASGVFMEIFDAPTASHPRKEFPSDLFSFCRSLPDFYKAVCLKNSGTFEFKRSKDPLKAYSWCKLLAEESQDECASSLGSDAYFILGGSPERIWEVCRAGGKLELDCVNGSLYSSLVSDVDGSEALAFCRLGESKEKEGCLSLLGKTIESIGERIERQNFCGKLLEGEKESCLR